ncbi:MAG: YitT family protein [Clostridia bacterium]|nr:YitT family protein [Clostridia bacterium]
MKSLKKMLCGIKPLSCIIIALSGVFLAFGLYNVHSLSGVTEGGILGLNLLLEYWFNISPAVTNFVFSAICYFIGWRTLGRKFIIYSAVAAASFSASYAVLERFPQLWPQLYEMPLVAAILGAVFVGVGTGVAVRCGGATCGDDALAMSISRAFGIKVQWAYLITDMTVLLLSLTYIPLGRIVYSLITVILSGQIIGLIQKIGENKKGL